MADLNYNRGLKPLPLTSQLWPNGRWYKSSSPVSSFKQNYLFIDSFSVLFSGGQSDCNSDPPIPCKENKDIKFCLQKSALQREAGNLTLYVFRPSDSWLRTDVKQTNGKQAHEPLLWNKKKTRLTSWKFANRAKQNLMSLLLLSILFSFCWAFMGTSLDREISDR